MFDTYSLVFDSLPSALDRDSFTVEAMVRGYHVYGDVWAASLGEELPCQREDGNHYDPYAVGVVKDGTIVGHLPRKISCVCSLYLRRSGTILCRVSGSRRYSGDLVQGGLEIPCILTFEGDAKLTSKSKKVIERALEQKSVEDQGSPPSKKRSDNTVCTKEPETVCTKEPETVWIKIGGLVLTFMEKERITQGEQLNDLIINAAQLLLKNQFPDLLGLRSTLLQNKLDRMKKNDSQLQILHSGGNHWIVASTISAPNDVVNVYDSIYYTISEETKVLISNAFEAPSNQVVVIQRQTGGQDCGLYAIAVSTALAFGLNPGTLKFNQAAMRSHLVLCLESSTLSPFPVV